MQIKLNWMQEHFDLLTTKCLNSYWFFAFCSYSRKIIHQYNTPLTSSRKHFNKCSQFYCIKWYTTNLFPESQGPTFLLASRAFGKKKREKVFLLVSRSQVKVPPAEISDGLWEREKEFSRMLQTSHLSLRCSHHSSTTVTRSEGQ